MKKNKNWKHVALGIAMAIGVTALGMPVQAAPAPAADHAKKAPIVLEDQGSYGMEADEVEADEEGLCNMRVLGHDMAYILKALETAKKYGVQIPMYENPLFTNFVTRENATK